MTARIFFERYRSLLPFILHELHVFISIKGTMIKSVQVQAILLLLSRLYINYHFDTDIALEVLPSGNDITWEVFMYNPFFPLSIRDDITADVFSE